MSLLLESLELPPAAGGWPVVVAAAAPAPTAVAAAPDDDADDPVASLPPVELLAGLSSLLRFPPSVLSSRRACGGSVVDTLSRK